MNTSTPPTVSEAAKDICAGWFMFGAKHTVVSHPPHATLSKHQAAVDELVTAGILTRAPYNDHGSIILTGTEEAGQIGRRRAAERRDDEDDL